MMNKIKKAFRVVSVDLLVYNMTVKQMVSLPALPYKIQSEEISGRRKRYFIKENGLVVHSSFLFHKLNVLRLIHKKGPAIGDCVTIPEYKGKSIYPFVIGHIAAEVLSEKETDEVFIFVHPNNAPSIRGIEKAGFKLLATITAKRFLAFYYNVNVEKQ